MLAKPIQMGIEANPQKRWD